jgi:hypothetical protein
MEAEQTNKTYKELCELFNEDMKTGRSRVLQINRWKRLNILEDFGKGKFNLVAKLPEQSIAESEIMNYSHRPLCKFILMSRLYEAFKSFEDVNTEFVYLTYADLSSLLGLINDKFLEIDNGAQENIKHQETISEIKRMNKPLIDYVLRKLDNDRICRVERAYLVSNVQGERISNSEGSTAIDKIYSDTFAHFSVANKYELWAMGFYREGMELIYRSLQEELGIIFHKQVIKFYSSAEQIAPRIEQDLTSLFFLGRVHRSNHINADRILKFYTNQLEKYLYNEKWVVTDNKKIIYMPPEEHGKKVEFINTYIRSLKRELNNLSERGVICQA